ncbi:hypothetical protein AJ80_03701 [Polytolypa hystricis UAMH7299]|uniref:Fungal N-terminal domain-containing protein n=1 Tax=Polytolypa hystricis (strain UAMH7299) TaxID=1447883 RepID=A0A2B7YG92_POLH7|nr:hypothetical protein AJ80_03701 [Polytolypa hystricis UAMH7299]
MPDISASANAFAVVGLADVIIRCAIQASDLYGRFKDASKSVARLLLDLRDLANIVTQLQSLASDQNDIVIRREIKATRNEIANAGQSIQTNLLGLQQHVTATSHTIQQRVEKVSAAVVTSGQANSTSFRTLEDHAKTLNNRLGSIDTRLAGHRNGQRVFLRRQKASTSKFLTRLDNVCSTLTRQIATISLRETENNGIIFEGENLGAIALPLMQMKGEIGKAIRTLRAEGSMMVSQSEARWIREQMEHLLARSHEDAAWTIRNKLPKRRPRPSQQDSPQRTSPIERTPSGGSHNGSKHGTSVSMFRRARKLQRRKIISSVATLLVEVAVQDAEADTTNSSATPFYHFG